MESNILIYALNEFKLTYRIILQNLLIIVTIFIIIIYFQ